MISPLTKTSSNAGGIRYEISPSGYSALPNDPSWAYWGITWLDNSTELTDWRDYLLTAVGIQENIFYTYGNHSDDLDPATNFQWAGYGPIHDAPLAIDISAIGRGLEPNTAVTLSWSRLVLFFSFMVNFSTQPWKNVTFEFSFALYPQTGRKLVNVPVARGWYAPLQLAPLALNPQGPQTT